MWFKTMPKRVRRWGWCRKVGVRPVFSVRETLRIQSAYFGLRRNDDWIDELLQHLGADRQGRGQYAPTVWGMKRRVFWPQALVHRPRVIVLDEPTAGVDVELRQTLWQFIARLNKQGHTVLLTTHYLEEAEALCHRIAMIKQGQLVALDKMSNLLAGTASTMLRFKTDQTLPDDLSAQARVTGRVVQLPARDAADVEAILGRLRQSGCQVEDLEMGRADLEDIFLNIMHGRNSGPRGASMSIRWGAAPSLQGNPAILESQCPDRRGAGAYCHPVSAHLRARAGRPRSGVQGGLHAFPFVPGLVMMSVLQNAFANSSSSLIQSKITGNLVFVLLTPLSHRAWFVAYVGPRWCVGWRWAWACSW